MRVSGGWIGASSTRDYDRGAGENEGFPGVCQCGGLIYCQSPLSCESELGQDSDGGRKDDLSAERFVQEAEGAVFPLLL